MKIKIHELEYIVKNNDNKDSEHILNVATSIPAFGLNNIVDIA